MNIIEQINKKGFYKLTNLINQDDLDSLKSEVQKKITSIGQKNFRLDNIGLEDTFINKAKFIEKIDTFIRNTSDQLELENYKNKKLYKILRVINGGNQKNESHKYHFDAHYLTLLIPIFIPNNKNNLNGDLVIFPNLRKVHRNIFLNVIQKLFFQNFFLSKLLNTNLFKKLLKAKILKLEPGNAYIFFGFRTLHGNQEINNHDLRATLLVHFYDVFEESKIVQMNRERKLKKEKNKIKIKV